MATQCISYQPEQTNHLPAPAKPRERSRRRTPKALPPSANAQPTLHLPDVSRDLPTEEALCQEIEKLCTEALTIDEAFYDIKRRLSDVSKEQNERTDVYDACYALETQWNEHHLTYQHLIWRSREFAGEAQGAVDDFREVVLPALRDRERPLSGKRKIIEDQIKTLDDTSQPSQRLCQEFLDFGRDLNAYITEFSRVVESLSIDKQITKVDGLEDRLQNAKDAMDAVNREVKELGWKFAGDVAITGINFLLALVVPLLWAKLADPAAMGIDYKNAKQSGLQFLDAWRRSNSAVIEYKKIKAEYELEEACLNQMVKLELALHDSRPLVQDITVKLGIFENVWFAITADIQKLKTSLKFAGNSTELFIIRVQRLENLYGYLSKALRHYQVTVRLPLKDS